MILWLLILILFASSAQAASVYDSFCTAAFTTTTTTNCSITIGSNANRAVSAALLMQSNGATSISCSGGGATGWALVSGTDSATARTVRALIWVGIAPTSGAQTITCSWTNNVTGRIGVISADGVNQITPMVNGNSANGTTANAAVTITTTTGNAAHDAAVALSGHALSAPTQTQVWLTSPSGQSRCVAAGASCAFSWTVGTPSGRQWVNSGAMFNPLVAAGFQMRRRIQ